MRVVALALVLASGPLSAATYTVSKTADTFDGVCNSDCSLRDAVHAANANPGLDTILLQAKTYTLSRRTPQPPELEDNDWFDEDGNEVGDLDIAGDLLIKGKGSSTAVDGGLLERVFEVLPGVSAEIRDLQIRRGYVPELGAGVANGGTLKLVRVRLLDNVAASGFNLGRGGAIFNGGTLSIADSQVRNNGAHGGEASSGEGGGIYNTGRLNVRTTIFTGNRTSDDNDIGGGGAIMNRGGFVTVDRSFFQGNSTSQHGAGGAIANRDGGTLRLTNSTVSGNSAGEPHYGGGAVANGTPWETGGKLTLAFATIADNDGGGVYSNGALLAYDSIIAGNYENFAGPERTYGAGNNCVTAGSMASAGLVLGLDGNCTSAATLANESALTTLLFPLANNGGFAPTHALRYGSPLAIDQATGAGLPCPATDQRGAARPFDGNGDGVSACDIGAFERNADD